MEKEDTNSQEAKSDKNETPGVEGETGVVEVVDPNQNIDEETKGEEEKIIEPVVVYYCGVCKLPAEFCEFGPNFERCKKWIAKNCPELYPALAEEFAALALEPDEESKEPVVMPGKKKPANSNAGGKVLITKERRGGNKIVTMISGLETFDVNIKDAAKFFGKKFACGCSKVKGEEGKPDFINIQGDFTYECIDLIEEKLKIDPAEIL